MVRVKERIVTMNIPDWNGQNFFISGIKTRSESIIEFNGTSWIIVTVFSLEAASEELG
jgi:hypothetical protein